MADEESKQEECPAGSPLWMCTFADLMSLLLCFFVLLLSFSVMDAKKYKKVAGSMRDAFGIQRHTRVTGSPAGTIILSTEFPAIPISVKLQQTMDEEIAEEVKTGKIETEITEKGLRVRIKDSVAFEFGKAKLRPKVKTILDKIGKIIAAMDVKVAVSGHTDNVPLKKSGSYSSNWSLSTARAVAVVEYWGEKFKIPAVKMNAVGYADGQPLESNDTIKGRAANRRVEFHIESAKTKLTFEELRDLLAE